MEEGEAERKPTEERDDCYSSINAGTRDGPATDNDRACNREKRGERRVRAGREAIALTGC